MMEQYPDILTVRNVCRILHMDKRTVYRLIERKELRARKIGRNYYIPKESLIGLFTNPDTTKRSSSTDI